MSSRSSSSPAGLIDPCIPTQSDRPPSGPGWLHEIKHDGFRLIARRDGAACDCSPATATTGATAIRPSRAPSAGSCRSCVIDGEVVICDEHGRAIFERLQEGPRVKPEATMFAFDLIELDGQNLRREPLLTRKSTLLSLIKGAPAGIRYNEHLEGDGT